MRCILFLLIAIFFIFSCKEDNNSGEIFEPELLTNQTIRISNVDRSYHLFVPDTYLNSPIVILFHGHSNDNDVLLGLGGENAPYSQWLNIAKEENIILVIPNGLHISSNEKGWNDCRSDASTNSEADDVLFISTLLDEIIDSYQANPNKVYISGTSNGGHMCIRLVNEIPEKITAFASIVASNAVNSECSNSSIPISALFMNGTFDPFLPYDGGEMASNRGEVFSTENTINYWVNRNGTDTTAEVLNMPNTNLNDDCNVEKHNYTNGDNNTEVVLYKILNGGHTEPSKVERYSNILTAILGNQNGDIEMADEIWSFFEGKSK